jgi:hypothetical protein
MKTIALSPALTTNGVLRRFRQSKTTERIIDFLFASGIGAWLYNMCTLILLY